MISRSLSLRAICIACGRAEVEIEEAGPLPAPMQAHRPLQRPKDTTRRDGLCPGNEATGLLIRRNVRFGAEMTIDVFEVQLNALGTSMEDRHIGLAIAAALREALSARLAVEATEIGVGIAPARREDGVQRLGLFLYDTASGGAGFAVAAQSEIVELLSQAARRLDCPTACTHGCPDCILRRDLQFDMRH